MHRAFVLATICLDESDLLPVLILFIAVLVKRWFACLRDDIAIALEVELNPDRVYRPHVAQPNLDHASVALQTRIPEIENYHVIVAMQLIVAVQLLHNHHLPVRQAKANCQEMLMVGMVVNQRNDLKYFDTLTSRESVPRQPSATAQRRNMSTKFVTAEMCYEAHRAMAGGVSGVNAAVKLPERLADCLDQVQRNWYGQACWQTFWMQSSSIEVAHVDNVKDIPLPPGVSEEDAAKLREKALRRYWADNGFYG